MAAPLEIGDASSWSHWASTLADRATDPGAPPVTPQGLAFAERYQVLEPVSSGSMGEVLRCHDRPFARDVAMKVLPHSARGSARWRFFREARVQAQLWSPAIVPVHDLGVDGVGRPFFTMEWIEGRNLSEHLEEGVEDVDLALRWIGQVARSVAYAHERGVVHRDLKPSNLRIQESTQAIYLLDWGLARVRSAGRADEEDDPIVDASGAVTTREGSVLGTIGYMSPEQLRGDIEDIGARSDVYALGVMLFEILSGEPLHVGTRAQRAVSVLQTDGAWPRQRAPDRDIDAALDGAVCVATRADASQRTLSAAQLADLLLG